MKKTGFLVKVGTEENSELIPAYPEDQNFILGLEEGELIEYSKDSQETRMHWRNKKYWMLLNKVVEHLPENMLDKYRSKESLHREIKLLNGYFDIHLNYYGKEVYVVDNLVGSTSFDRMSESEFKEFVDKARNTILKYFLFEVSTEDFDKEFMRLIFD